jgi:hypothetical protein
MPSCHLPINLIYFDCLLGKEIHPNPHVLVTCDSIWLFIKLYANNKIGNVPNSKVFLSFYSIGGDSIGL